MNAAVRKSRASRRRQAGFTLIEMIVATIILAIGVVAALAAVSASTDSAYMAERTQTAALLAQQKLAELELQPTGLTAGDQQGDFSPDFPEYRWHEVIEPTAFQNLYQVTLTIQWGTGSARPHEQVFVTYLQQQQQAQNGTLYGIGGMQQTTTGNGQQGSGANGSK